MLNLPCFIWCIFYKRPEKVTHFRTIVYIYIHNRHWSRTFVQTSIFDDLVELYSSLCLLLLGNWSIMSREPVFEFCILPLRKKRIRTSISINLLGTNQQNGQRRGEDGSNQSFQSVSNLCHESFHNPQCVSIDTNNSLSLAAYANLDPLLFLFPSSDSSWSGSLDTSCRQMMIEKIPFRWKPQITHIWTKERKNTPKVREWLLIAFWTRF
jgi:hypothetical protein